MKKILFCLSSLTRNNGISKFIMNYYDELSKKYSIDFLISWNTVDSEYRCQIESKGGKIYSIDSPSKFIRTTYSYFVTKKLIQENKYDIIHINLLQQFALGCILAAKKLKVRKIIFHVHTQYNYSNIRILRKIIHNICVFNSTNLVACSSLAGVSNFKNKDFIVLRNAMDFSLYKFSYNDRIKFRKEFNLKNKIIIGTVGRICDEKNPFLVLNIFNQLLKYNPNYYLVWVGNGEKKYEKRFKMQIEKMNLTKYITITGSRVDANKMYSMFDFFLLPSKSEGLGIVFLESQASGLRTFASTKVPIDVKQTDLLTFLDLKKDYKELAKIINESLFFIKDRNKYENIMSNSNFNLAENINIFNNLYM